MEQRHAGRPPSIGESEAAPAFALDEFLPHRLSVVSARAHRLFARAYADRASLSVPEWLVLSVLAGCLLAGEAQSPGTRDHFPYLVEIPADPVRFDSFALIISGDGGWADLDQQLGEILQERGMSVLGWDSLNYFWKHRKAEEVAQDLDKATNAKQTAMHPFRHPHYILLGLALGGDNGGDVSKTTFPSKFEIDYVRVYQKE